MNNSTSYFIGALIFLIVAVIHFAVDHIYGMRNGDEWEQRNYWYNTGCIFFGMTMYAIIEGTLML